MSQNSYLKLPVNKAVFYLSDYVEFNLKLFKFIEPKFGSWGYTYEDKYDENPYLKKVHPIIKALHYLFEVRGFTHEGGFDELYSYEFDFGLWQCLQGLYEIGEHELLTVICFAIEFFEKTDKNLSENDRITQLLQKGVSDVDFGLPSPISYTNLKITSIEELDDLFDELCDTAERKIVHFIKQNPSQFVVDENGLPFDENFTGVYENRELELGYILPMQNGKPHGKFEIFDKTRTNWVGEFNNGFLKSQSYLYFSDYSKTYSRYDYVYEPYDEYTIIVTCLTFYDDNIQPKKQKREIEQRDYKKIGIQKEWYENGQIKETKDYFDPLNDRFYFYESYYENGQLKVKGLYNFSEMIYGKWYYEDGKKRGHQFFDEKGYQHITEWSKEGVVTLYSAFDRYGEYIEHRSFYPSGAKKQIYILHNKANYYSWREEIRQAWDENGNQTIIDGNGVIVGKHNKEYRDGLLRLCTYFYETGEIHSEEYYGDDKVYTMYYNKDGSVR